MSGNAKASNFAHIVRRWSCALLKPDGLYPTRLASGGNKSAKFKVITTALKSCEMEIITTDCDREGQIIGQEILEHLRYRGHVRRTLCTAQDLKMQKPSRLTKSKIQCSDQPEAYSTFPNV